MSNLFKSILLFSIMNLVGCAGIQVTMYSDPPGATIYADNKTFGYAPQVLNYQPTEAFRKGVCMTTTPITAIWASGASDTQTLNLCPQNGYQTYYTFIRPNVAGREIDANFALQLQQLQFAQQKEAAARYDRALKALSDYSKSLNNTNAPIQNESPTKTDIGTMCSYSDGSVDNIGVGICPESRKCRSSYMTCFLEKSW